VLDVVLLMFDQALSRRGTAAREKLKDVLAGRARGGEDRQALPDDILTIVLDPEVTDEQVGGRLRAAVPATSGCGRRTRPAAGGCPATTATWP
jgi:hypothetical protein